VPVPKYTYLDCEWIFEVYDRLRPVRQEANFTLYRDKIIVEFAIKHGGNSFDRRLQNRLYLTTAEKPNIKEKPDSENEYIEGGNHTTLPEEKHIVAENLFPLLGLDVSASKIGLAIADTAAAMPHPLFTYLRITRARDLSKCAEWVDRYQALGVVIGYPLNMDGSVGDRARWMQRFRRELQARIPIQVFFQDERLSTVEADEILISHGLTREARADSIDAVAAALILERFLHER